MWIWHSPALFAAALASAPLHMLQHACFFASALVFWWAMFASPRLFGLTPLEDQQLGGLIMWVPGSLAYVVVGLTLVGAWLVPSQRVQRSTR